MGFAVPVPAAQLASHEQRIRAEGFPDYRVSPPGKRDFYTAIVYLEPFDWRNQRAFGYDMYSEPVRREAMERARALGVPALSGRVRLVQETSSDVQAGVLLYLPVFQRGAPLETPAQRDQAFMGWVYAPFRLGDLMLGTLGRRRQPHPHLRRPPGRPGHAPVRQRPRPGPAGRPAHPPLGARTGQPDLDADLRRAPRGDP